MEYGHDPTSSSLEISLLLSFYNSKIVVPGISRVGDYFCK